MKILIIGKYLPEAGSVSQITFSLTRQLVDEGNEVFIVTDSWCCDKHNFIEISPSDVQLINNNKIRLFSLDPLDAISETTNREKIDVAFRLIALALKVHNQYGVDVIFSTELNKYGFAAHTLKTIIERPVVISDYSGSLERTIFNYNFSGVFDSLFKYVDLIIGYSHQREQFNLVSNSNYKSFNPFFGQYSKRIQKKDIVEDNENSNAENRKDNNTMYITCEMNNKRDMNYIINYFENMYYEYNLKLNIYGKERDAFKEKLKSSKLNKYSYVNNVTPWQECKYISESQYTVTTNLIMYFRKRFDQTCNDLLKIICNKGKTILDSNFPVNEAEELISVKFEKVVSERGTVINGINEYNYETNLSNILKDVINNG